MDGSTMCRRDGSETPSNGEIDVPSTILHQEHTVVLPLPTPCGFHLRAAGPSTRRPILKDVLGRNLRTETR
jgi:hypothetical protein